mgnify:CR=1 FL=1
MESMPAVPVPGPSFVRLRGIPFSATEQDVAQWFASAPGGPVNVVRVIFTYNNAGRKTGESYVELPEYTAERAVQVLHNRNMQSRYIEVFMSSETEAAQAMVAPPPPGMPMAPNGATGMPQQPQWVAEVGAPAGSNGLMKLRGLPFNAVPDQILQFFSGFDVPKGVGGIHLVLGANGRPNGEAFVEFGSEEHAEAAMVKDKQTIGTRYVEVFRSTPEQMHQALSRGGKSNNLAPGMAPGMMGHPAYGHAPYGHPYSMAPPMPHAYGQPPVGAMAHPPGPDAVVKMRGLPYKVSRNEILEFFSGLVVPLNGVHLMFNEREQPTGEAYVEFGTQDDRERAMTKDRQHMGGRYVELFRVSRAEMIQALEQFVGGYMSNNPMPPQMMHPQGMGAMGGAYGMYGGAAGPYGGGMYGGGPPACGGPGAYGVPPGMYPPGPGGPPHGGAKNGTVRMRGLPFRATVDDIFRFFQGFQVMPGGIVLGQRDGRASGEAWVTFASPQEAQRAMGKNNTNMQNRYIELFAA